MRQVAGSLVLCAARDDRCSRESIVEAVASALATGHENRRANGIGDYRHGSDFRRENQRIGHVDDRIDGEENSE